VGRYGHLVYALPGKLSQYSDQDELGSNICFDHVLTYVTSVDTRKDNEMDDRGSVPSSNKGIYTYILHSVKPGYGAHPASYPISSERSLIPGIRRQGREAYHSPPNNAELRNSGAILPLHHTSSGHGKNLPILGRTNN
jgi:hypothetical protein